MKSEKVYHFSQANPKGSNQTITELLRRVADSVGERKGAVIKDIVLGMAKVNPQETSLSVYYRYLKGVESPSTDDKYEIRTKQLVMKYGNNKDFSELLQGSSTELKDIGDAEIYDLTLDNVDDENGERYILAIYYD